MKVPQGLYLFEGKQHIRFSGLDYGRVDGSPEADVAGDGTSALRHPVDLVFFHVISVASRHAPEHITGQNDPLAADADDEDIVNAVFAHDASSMQLNLQTSWQVRHPTQRASFILEKPLRFSPSAGSSILTNSRAGQPVLMQVLQPLHMSASIFSGLSGRIRSVFNWAQGARAIITEGSLASSSSPITLSVSFTS